MSYKIKDIPVTERPRERFLQVGANNLSDSEILSIILKTGTRDKSVSDLAIEVLNKYELQEFGSVSLDELMKIKGIGLVKAIEIMSAIELGKRIFLNRSNICKRRLMNAKDIYEDSKYLFSGLKQECFYCLYFNNKRELIGRKLLFMGTINKSITHPREVFKEAYKHSASSIVCMHNHPSNDLKPSKEDILFTNSLVEVGKIQGIPIVDHIIVGDGEYYSFYEHHNILNL